MCSDSYMMCLMNALLNEWMMMFLIKEGILLSLASKRKLMSTGCPGKPRNRHTADQKESRRGSHLWWAGSLVLGSQIRMEGLGGGVPTPWQVLRSRSSMGQKRSMSGQWWYIHHCFWDCFLSARWVEVMIMGRRGQKPWPRWKQCLKG